MNDMKKAFSVLSVVMFLLLGICLAPVAGEGASYNYNYKKVDERHSFLKGKNSASMDVVGGRYYRLHLRRKSSSVCNVVYDVSQPAFANGRYCYYARRVSGMRCSIYRYSFSSGKSVRLATVTMDYLEACNGKYLFYARDVDAGEGTLCRFSIASKKTKKLSRGINEVVPAGTKLLGFLGAAEVNVPIYVFNRDGSGKKKIASGTRAVFSKGKVYYISETHKNGRYRIQVYSCKLNGSGKKALTGKLLPSSLPAKYRKMGL